MITTYCDRRVLSAVSAALAAVSLAVCFSSCKPRIEQGGSRTLSDSGYAKLDVSPEAAAQTQAVKAACSAAGVSLMRGTHPGVIEYSVVKTPAPANSESVQTEWYEEAVFKENAWHLSAAIQEPSTPAFLRGRRTLSSKEFIAALGCTTLRIADVATEVCAASSHCSISLAQASFNLPLPGMTTGQDSVLALTSSGVSTELDCVERDGRSQLTNGSADVGKTVDSPHDCRNLMVTGRDGLVCAWTGSSFDIYRTSGVRLSEAGGTKSLASCVDQIRTFTNGLVCALDGDGYYIHRMESKAERLGISGTLDVCRERIAKATDKRVCASDGKGIWVHDLTTGKPVVEFGSFGEEISCQTVLAVLDDVKIAELIKENVRLAAATNVVNKTADDNAGENRKDNQTGLSLAGDVGYTYKDCHDPSRGYHIVQTNGSELICKMDTLYSWGPRSKVQWLKDQSWSGQLRRNSSPQPVFTSQSPYATFGYGDYAIRFRLKDGVRYRYISEGNLKNPYEYCGQLSSSELRNTIIVRWWKNNVNYTGLDFILCSLSPVHSWSYGTQEHLNEINADIEWIRTKNYKDYELYVKVNGVDVALPDKLDSHAFNNTVLRANLTRHAQELGNEIFYNPDAEKKSAFWHFSTKWPIYFNPKRYWRSFSRTDSHIQLCDHAGTEF